MESPKSSQQSSAEESRQEFNTRMLNMVSQLESTDTIFFYKIVTKSMATEMVDGPFAYCLEFPNDFLTQHSKKFTIYVIFGLEDSERTWPIKLTVRYFKQSKARVFAYGPGGWKTFLMDNHIKVGDILVFSLISFSHFQVYIGRAPLGAHPDNNSGSPLEVHLDDDSGAPVEVHPDDDDEDNQKEVDMDIEEQDEDDDDSSAEWFGDPSLWWNADQAPVSCRVCKQAPPCPRFLVTIRPSSHSQHSSLVVPGRFWELHGSMLECNDLQLRGPNQAICMVKANRIYNVEEEKLSVCLASRWEAFRAANKFRVGDVLEFSLVGNSCFTVDLVERIEED